MIHSVTCAKIQTQSSKYFQCGVRGEWEEVGRTETLENTLDPEWQTSFTLDYYFHQTQVWKVMKVKILMEMEIQLMENDPEWQTYFHQVRHVMKSRNSKRGGHDDEGWNVMQMKILLMNESSILDHIIKGVQIGNLAFVFFCPLSSISITRKTLTKHVILITFWFFFSETRKGARIAHFDRSYLCLESALRHLRHWRRLRRAEQPRPPWYCRVQAWTGGNFHHLLTFVNLCHPLSTFVNLCQLLSTFAHLCKALLPPPVKW